MTDFRALCAELIEAWDDLPWEWESDFKGAVAGIHSDLYDDIAVARARAALAEPMSPSAEPMSSSAEAVLDAFFASGWEDEPLHANIAAALETAADLVAPEEDAMPLNFAHRVRWDTLQSVRYQLLVIAAELEALND